ncbi:hypothetical protein BH09DEP1_BH09DEP1_4030 [soil metagenome]
MKQPVLFFIYVFCVTSTILGFESAPKAPKKRSVTKSTDVQKRSWVDIDDFIAIPKIPGIPESIVLKRCEQMREMKEEWGRDFWFKVVERVMSKNSTFTNIELKPIMNRLVEDIISLAQQETIPVEQAKDTIQKNAKRLGYILYGTLDRGTSYAKWNAVRQQIIHELQEDGFELQGQKKNRLK